MISSFSKPAKAAAAHVPRRLKLHTLKRGPGRIFAAFVQFAFRKTNQSLSCSSVFSKTNRPMKEPFRSSEKNSARVIVVVTLIIAGDQVTTKQILFSAPSTRSKGPDLGDAGYEVRVFPLERRKIDGNFDAFHEHCEMAETEGQGGRGRGGR